jgi:hypothetical protein
MKRYLLALLLFLFAGAWMSGSAEMVWVGLNPTIQASNKSSEAVIESATIQQRDDLTAGSIVSIYVNDSSANADSTYATYYSYPINTEDVISATGLVEITLITDTSTDAASPFTQYGDSTYARYAIKTGFIPYDASTDYSLVAYSTITAVSGTAVQIPITLNAATVGQDTLFKPWTWFEITFLDTTRWGELYTQYFRISGTGDSATTIAGTYNTTGFDRYKYWIIDPGADDDSIGWCHADADGANIGTIDTADITGSAQNLDSGMTINFASGIGHTDKDTFMFYVSDSLHYGKRTDFTVRMGLNLLRKK